MTRKVQRCWGGEEARRKVMINVGKEWSKSQVSLKCEPQQWFILWKLQLVLTDILQLLNTFTFTLFLFWSWFSFDGGNNDVVIWNVDTKDNVHNGSNTKSNAEANVKVTFLFPTTVGDNNKRRRCGPFLIFIFMFMSRFTFVLLFFILLDFSLSLGITSTCKILFAFSNWHATSQSNVEYGWK